jgi:hypothetical protein
VSTAELLGVVQLCPDLHRDGLLLWQVPDRGRAGLSRPLARALSAGPLTVEALGEALRVALRVALRHNRHVHAPEPGLLRRYLRTQPQYRLHGDTTSLVDAPRRLTRADEALLAAFAATGADELPTAALVAAVRAAGYAEVGARHVLRTSPLLRRSRRGHYSPRTRSA